MKYPTRVRFRREDVTVIVQSRFLRLWRHWRLAALIRLASQVRESE